MPRTALLLASTLLIPLIARANSPILCEGKDPASHVTSIWPAPYLSNSGALCFDVTAWSGYSGRNCAESGKPAAWTGVVIVTEDGDSRGRDATQFRARQPVVTEDRIAYSIEWRRGDGWRPMQRVEINRLTGVAVSSFVTTHGGEAYQCRLGKKAI